MIVSNVDLLRQKALNAQNEDIESSDEFKNTVLSSLGRKQTSSKTDALTYENIKGISLEEIDILFKDEEKRSLAKNLRLATLFTSDNFLGKAIFNTVLGQPFDIGYNYLFNKYEDKHSFLNPKGRNLSDMLHDSITRQIDDGDKKATDVISEERLGELLTEINSFNFVSALSSTSKDQYNRYKDEDDNYSYLYNNRAIEYGELLQRFKDMEDETNRIISQFWNSVI